MVLGTKRILRYISCHKSKLFSIIFKNEINYLDVKTLKFKQLAQNLENK